MTGIFLYYIFRKTMKKLISLQNITKFAVAYIVITLTSSCSYKTEPEIIVGIPDEWGNITPPILHSVYTNAITINQFEPLIKVDRNGMLAPLAAKAWSISPDFDEISFKIDTTRRFSNGKFLTAQDVKTAWEKGLLASFKVSDGAFRDLLSRVKGYKDFKKSKKLSGLIADGDMFIIKFEKPLRAAINFITNTRFGVYLEEKGKFIGTGQYEVIYNDGRILEMIPNKYFKTKQNFSKVRVIVVKPEDAEKKLKSDEIQAYLFAEKAIIKSCYNNYENYIKQFFNKNKIKCISGRIGRHEYISLNGSEKSIFSNPKYRKAAQALLLYEIQKTGLPEYMRLNQTKIDSQVYLEFQLGRLSDEEAVEIINEGNKYIQEFVNRTKENPIRLLTYDKPNWIQELLQKRGITFTSNSGYVPKNVVLKYFYGPKEHAPDMLVGGVSLANGDPDNLYHSLGKYGVHTPPMSRRPQLMNLLESGRSIIDRKKANEHYKEVSRAVLREVPFIHIGFSRNILAYRLDKVKVNESVKDRDLYGLDIFTPY